ncbi:MAG: type II toxin-antitoxin system RelB/DinJ family antitoxin [Synergistaceae bacterium]|nr:type II toxin-antitoxin system RelB/DinJ family antitoxin [Synergistaceae bacterium]
MGIVIQVEPELGRQAEVVFEQLGTSISDAMNTLLRYVVSRKKLPDDFSRPPIPCIDDMTEEEFDAMIQESFKAVNEGRTYTIDEARRILEADDEAL